MEQFIILELITKYHTKYKYDDFDWVTRTIIRRKVIDFVSNHYRRTESVLLGDQISQTTETTGGDNDIVSNRYFIDKSLLNHKELIEKEKIVFFVKEIQYKINNPPYKVMFNDWCREFLEVTIWLYELGYDCAKEDIIECMGYDVPTETTKFNAKLLAFRNKLQENFNISIDMLQV